jgi:TonB family protein
LSGPGDLLGSVPFGGVLSGVLRLLLAEERREEFVGDLIEQARDELYDRPPAEIGLWLWGQTVHSAPALLVARVRHLLRRAAGFSHPGTPRLAAGLLAGDRMEARSWPLPMAVSVSVHAVALSVLFVLTLGQIEEVQAPWRAVSIRHALAPLAPVVSTASEPPAQLEPRRHRKARPAVRPTALAATALVPPTAPVIGDEPEVPIEDPEVRKVVVVLPPVVAEKRCLSCPRPRLPPAYVQLGVEQKVVVKTCVGAHGNVTSVNVLRGLGPLADASVVDTVRGWRFTPHSVGDHPVPFCYPTRFVFTMN